MELQQLKYFLCASRTASFADVADEFGVSRQAISSSIKSLESELKIVLFDRSHNRLALTPEAKEFAVRTEETIALFGALEERCKTPVVRNLTLSLDSFLFESNSCILESVLAYSDCSNGCTVSLSQESFFRAFRNVEKRTSDIGIVRMMHSDIPGCECIILRSAFLGCAISERHALAKRDSLRIADLKGERLILPNGYSRRYEILMQEDSLGLPSLPITSIDEKTIAVEAIRKNYGVGITDCIDVNERCACDGIVHVPFTNPEYQVFDILFFRKDNPNASCIRHFADWIIDNNYWKSWNMSHSADC